MEYYRCLSVELTEEIRRRGFRPYGNQDQLSEALKRDDDNRGSEATTVMTVPIPYVPSEVNLTRSVEFGASAHAHVLVGERESSPSPI